MTKNKNMQNVGSSETIRNESCTLFFHWLAGLIDADGGFYISRQRYVSCEITMHEKEIQTLYWIKKKLGGTVQLRKGKKSCRWRLHKKQPMYELVHFLNGCFKTERVQKQFREICHIYGIKQLESSPFTLDTAWFSGFFSGDGSFSINISAKFQPSLSIGQAEKLILDQISTVLGGGVYYDKSWNGWIWWIDARALQVDLWSYFSKFPLYNPYKQARLKSIVRFLGYLERELHRDPKSQGRLLHFVRVFQGKQD